MMTKSLKRVMAMTLIMIFTIGGMTFADTTTTPTVLREENQARMTNVFENYNPEKVDAFIALNAEHMAFHTGQAAKREALLEQAKTTFAAIRDQVTKGDLTREEGLATIAAIRSENEATRAEVQSVLELKRTELELLKSVNEDIRGTLKTLLTAEVKDTVAIQEILDEILMQLSKHIEIDQKYAAMIDEIVYQ